MVQGCLGDSAALLARVGLRHERRVVPCILSRLQAFPAQSRSGCILIGCCLRPDRGFRPGLEFRRRFLLSYFNMGILRRLVAHRSLVLALIRCRGRVEVVGPPNEIDRELLARVRPVFVLHSGLVRIQISAFDAALSIVQVALVRDGHGVFGRRLLGL